MYHFEQKSDLVYLTVDLGRGSYDHIRCHDQANFIDELQDLMKRILSESKRNEDSNTRNEAFTRLKNFVDLNSREHIGTTQSRCVYPFIAVS
jgi:hypothetical protein